MSAVEPLYKLCKWCDAPTDHPSQLCSRECREDYYNDGDFDECEEDGDGCYDEDDLDGEV